MEASYDPDHLPDKHGKLACQACQRKKIKCDRTYPCGQCQRSNLQCHPSTRKLRTRNIGKRAADSELRNRITKLESLVQRLSGETEGPDDHEDGEEVAIRVPAGVANLPESTSLNVGKYIGNNFWTTLTNEVQALRDAIEEEASDEEQAESPNDQLHNGPSDSNHDLIVCPPGSIYVMPGALPEPPPYMERQLYDIFLHNADPVFKLLHRPTLKRWLEGGKPYLGHSADAPPNKSLKAAMWFSAGMTLRDMDCLARFRTSRTELLQHFRRIIDVYLAKADLMNTSDLATLQAAVLYTASSRLTDLSRRTWTMTGLIVRIAYGIGLHHEVSSDSPYTKEMKRRLWHQIRVLDSFAAVDRGTDLLIALTSFDTPLPSNVNDAEFDESSQSVEGRESGLTDMTFNLMAYSVTTLTMQLMKPETNGSKGDTWQQRLDSALLVGKELREKYLQYCDLSKPFHRFLYAVGGSMSASSVLRAVRPMQRHVSSIPPRVDSPFVLQLAVNSLRESEATHQDPEAEGWRWIFWVQWHSLAVALAGLCCIRDTELATTAWVYVDKAWERHCRQVAETRSGTLWRPIEKLYKKASAFRDDRSSPASSASPPKANSLHLPTEVPMAQTPYQQVPNAQTGLLPVGMPTPGVMNRPMDYSFGEGFSPLQGGDFSWSDWENIISDIQPTQNVGGMEGQLRQLDIMSNTGLMHGNVSLGSLQQPQGQAQMDWPGPMHQNPM